MANSAHLAFSRHNDDQKETYILKNTLYKKIKKCNNNNNNYLPNFFYWQAIIDCCEASDSYFSCPNGSQTKLFEIYKDFAQMWLVFFFIRIFVIILIIVRWRSDYFVAINIFELLLRTLVVLTSSFPVCVCVCVCN